MTKGEKKFCIEIFDESTTLFFKTKLQISQLIRSGVSRNAVCSFVQKFVFSSKKFTLSLALHFKLPSSSENTTTMYFHYYFLFIKFL